MGEHGYDKRNERGNTLLDLYEYAMNSFFKKSKQKRCTWASPDGITKNEIF